MQINRRIMALLASATLLLVPLPAQSIPAAAQPLPGAIGDGPDTTPRGRPVVPGQQSGGEHTRSDPLCRPGTPPNAPPTTAYYDNNALLGPATLPKAPPVGPLLAGYQRFGGLSETAFINQYTNAAHDAYVYPPAGGFVVGPDGRPIMAAQTLLPGYRLDRFGFPGGQYLSPLGTPFSSRALPPSNLNTPQNAPLANYHTYCVVKPFTVDSGPIAPWFAQPGMGTQFKLNATYLPQAGSDLSVTWLLTNGFLVEENLVADRTQRCDRRTDASVC